MRIDHQVLSPLLAQEPLVVVEREYGTAGTNRFKAILTFLKRCAQHSQVDAHSRLLVFSFWGPDGTVDTLRLAQAKPFLFGVTHRGLIQNMFVEIREDGSPFFWPALPSEITTRIATGMAYRLEQAVEVFEVKGRRHPVPKVIEGAISQFCVNHFTNLKEALMAYRDQMARTSRCYLLVEAWDDKDTRVWFRRKPEFILRRALCNYLVSCLRNDSHELRPEQNVNEKNPVDIKVLWRMENRSAIIEVKWLGCSVEKKGAKWRFTVNHAESRANEGAKQLAEYMEDYRRASPHEDARAYLVVFDCRRHRVGAAEKNIDAARGMYFEKREITYNPRYHEQRHDFEEPIRMFLEPHCV
jgi:hypothetical protein